MPLVHSREELEAVTKALSDKAFIDGVLWDVPKARRREQARNPQRQITLKLDGDLKIRMATQINRYVEIFGKAVGWDALLKRIEWPSDLELRMEARGEQEQDAERPSLRDA